MGEIPLKLLWWTSDTRRTPPQQAVSFGLLAFDAATTAADALLGLGGPNLHFDGWVFQGFCLLGCD